MNLNFRLPTSEGIENRHGILNSQVDRVRTVPITALDREVIEAWFQLQRRHPIFESPFFRPEFSQVLGRFSPGIEVAVIERGGRPAGFWPFERGRFNVAYAPGRDLCPYEGIVCSPNDLCPPSELLLGCRLSAWRFNQLVTSQPTWQSCCLSHSMSAVIDLADGFNAYLQRDGKRNSATLRTMKLKKRRLERDVGRLEFAASTEDEHVLDTLVAWKRAQFARIRCRDQLAPSWRREFLTQIIVERSPDFSGMFSALYAGNHLVAAHLGIRSRHILHWWIPSYNRAFERYSPGTLLLMALAEQAADLGIARIDLGNGTERYKESLKTGDVIVGQGVVDPYYMTRAIRQGCWRARHALSRSPLANPLRNLIRSYRGFRGYQKTQLIDPGQTCVAEGTGPNGRPQNSTVPIRGFVS